ncbi:histidine kinase [Bacillus sp. 2205SS5-2]|uniref:histidine kinase n=1 Tax=Bacillus sp. 2205SS5-2 TaxID=3109031 RepID=UPI003004ADE6
MKRFTIIGVIALIVLILCISILNNDYEEIGKSMILTISIGGAILSGVITYFLFPQHEKDVTGK